MLSAKQAALLLSALMLFSNALVYLPFWLTADDFLGVPLAQTGMDVVKRYWDGPLYVVVSQTFYAPSTLFSFGPLPPTYYAAHLVLYPLSIRLLSFLASPSDAMLLSTFLFSIASVLAFYFFVKDFHYSKNPLWLSTVFIFFPARWLIYHSVGATEAPFIFFSLASLYFFKKERYWPSAVFGMLAALTRIFGVWLFVFYSLFFLWKKRSEWKRAVPFLLIPFALFLHFLYYHFVYNDFFAYWRVNSFVLSSMPFNSLLSYGGPAVGEYWLLLYALYGAGIARLYEQKRHDLALYSALLFLPTLFISFNDIARYLLPIFPFALLIAFDDVVNLKLARWLFPAFVFGALVQAWYTLPLNLMPADQYARLLGLL